MRCWSVTTLAWRHIPLQIDIVSLLGPYIEQGGLLLLLLSILLGYLLLSFFFYDTNKQHQARQVWDSLHSYWQSLSAILLGGFLFLVFWYGLYPFLNYLQVQAAPEISIDPVKWWLATSAVIVLLTFLLRWEVGQPIYSRLGLARMQTIINHIVFVWGPVYGLLFVVVVTISSLFLYPTTGPTPLLFWLYLFPRALFFVLGVWSTLWVYYAICAFSSPVQKPSGAITSLASQFSKTMRQRVSWPRFIKRFSFRSPSPVAIGLAITILLAVLMPLTDAQFGLVTPKITYVETQLSDSYNVVGDLDNYSVLIHKTQTLFINAPVLSLPNKRTVILNPSNRSFSETQSWETVSWKLIGDKGEVVSIKSDDQVTGFYVTMSPATNNRIVLELSYYDRLSYPIISVSPVSERNFSNGTVRRQMQIIIKNPFDKRLDFQQMFVTYTPGNITRIDCTRNGEPFKCTDMDPSKRNLYLNLTPTALEPGEIWTLVLVYYFTRQ
jgi:hypothetical protein